MKNDLILKILKQSKNRVFNIKTLLVLTVLILNISAFYHFYRELKILQENVGATVLGETIASPEAENELHFIKELKVKNEELTNRMEELEKRDAETTNRVQKLEGVFENVGATVLGETTASPETENELNLIEELRVKNEELANRIEELEKRDAETTNRVQKLEGVSVLLGETLEICEVVPKAYHKFAPDSGLGLESELNRCASSYYKLKNSF